MKTICNDWYLLNGVPFCPHANGTGCRMSSDIKCGLPEPEEKPLNLWQTCPKCSGQGKVWFPPNMPFNETYATNGEPFDCDVCEGQKIISVLTGKPPQK